VFDEMNFDKMHTKVLENNPTALKLYEKFGFKKERELKEKLERTDKQINIFIMCILKEEWKALKKQRYSFKMMV
ncbi:MAG: GNAT family N-acetyltransferase, partial [Thermoplasmatales archaeon]|nr:GNAT family N-acetyltransferase [Thermoplasmatales archaeon]